MENNCNKDTVDDIKKCLSNACRLSMDSLNTSEPTSAVLMEIGIEEIAKGLILFSNCHKPFDGVVSLDKKELRFLEKLAENLKNSGYSDIKKLNIYWHSDKLKAIQAIIDTFNLIDPFNLIDLLSGTGIKDIILSEFDSISPEFKSPEFKKNLFSMLDRYKIDDKNILKNLDVTKLDKGIKENGLYVDIKKHKAPSENNFQIDKLKGILFIFTLILHTFVKVEETGNLKNASKDSVWEIFECLYGINNTEKFMEEIAKNMKNVKK